MKPFRSFTLYWLPVVLWLVLIFSASTNAGSSHRTSRFIGPLLRWLKPDISREAIRKVELVLRKTAHLGVYAILAVLLWRAKRKGLFQEEPEKKWSWRDARFVLLVSILYAASDEFHQHFVTSRQSSALDIGIDALGASLGLGVIWLGHRMRKNKVET